MGNYFDEDYYDKEVYCENCKYYWQSRKRHSLPSYCPNCKKSGFIIYYKKSPQGIKEKEERRKNLEREKSYLKIFLFSIGVFFCFIYLNIFGEDGIIISIIVIAILVLFYYYALNKG